MECNVGKADKMVRIVVGLAIVAAGIWFKTWWGVVGVIPLITAFMGCCPLYIPFGISSCKKEG